MSDPRRWQPWELQTSWYDTLKVWTRQSLHSYKEWDARYISVCMLFSKHWGTLPFIFCILLCYNIKVPGLSTQQQKSCCCIDGPNTCIQLHLQVKWQSRLQSYIKTLDLRFSRWITSTVVTWIATPCSFEQVWHFRWTYCQGQRAHQARNQRRQAPSWVITACFCWFPLRLWRWKQYVFPKHKDLSKLHIAQSFMNLENKN
jgi:hypothetical protein